MRNIAYRYDIRQMEKCNAAFKFNLLRSTLFLNGFCEDNLAYGSDECDFEAR